MIVSVIPLRPVAQAYSYYVPAGQHVAVGQVVRIPFGKKQEAEHSLGVVWALQADTDIEPSKLKTLEIVPEWPVLSEDLRHFLEWSAQYTLAPLGMFCRMALPISDVTRTTPTQTRYRLSPLAAKADHDKLSAARGRVLDVLQKGALLSRGEILATAHVSDSVIRALVDAGWLEQITVSADEDVNADIDPSSIQLPQYNEAQTEAAARLVTKVKAEDFSVTLLDGVTGSGKTEVYFAAIKQALEQGKQALILVPEIALTSQFLERFTKRFGIAPIAWHSHLTPAQRRRHLKAIVSGHARVVLGARSALFLPHQNLGLVVIDEEHDSSYKQEEGVFYNARDLAIKRAQIEKFPVMLVSATPSLETWHHAQSGKYDWVKLPTRFAAAQLPDVNVIDMRAEKMRRTEFLSPHLIEAMKATLDKGEQVMLYLNRRGFAPLTLCRTCGHRIECPRCSAWMVQHRSHGGLMCHHCGWHMRPPKHCAQCNAEDSLVACGPGVERIEDEAKQYFPDKRIVVLSSDTHKSMSAISEVLHRIQNREIDIIIGTQIIAKGHHFPSLTLVGVVDADLGLGGGDLRAGERTFQILHQVSGRAGRGDKPGHVLLQSFMPEHRVIQTLVAGDRDAFLQVEADERIQSQMPPAGRLAGIIIRSKDEDKARRFANELAQIAPSADAIRILGPAPAPIYKLRHQFRYRILVKAAKDQNIQKYVLQWLSRVKIPSAVRVQVDIDPYSFM